MSSQEPLVKIYKIFIEYAQPVSAHISELCLPIGLILRERKRFIFFLDKNMKLQNELSNFEKITKNLSKIMYASISDRVAN